MRRCFGMLAVAVGMRADALTAQLPAFPADSGLRAYLVTIGPGAEVWELFGHNAIWIHDPVLGTDLAYDYGRFDFREKNFLKRLALGQMAYSMDSASIGRLLPAYASRDRRVDIQELALTPVTIRALEANLLEDVGRVHREGWTYRYDYYRDNCSTRLRDALDVVTGGSVAEAMQGRLSTLTYRDHALRSAVAIPGLGFALDLIQGPVVDRPLDAWGEAFLPGKLQEHLREVRVVGADGTPTALVRREWTEAAADRYAVPEAPPTRWPVAFLFGVGGGVLLWGLASRGMRRGFVSLAGVWLGVTTVLGLVMLWLWGFSTHVVAYRNLNLFQANLLAPALLVVLPGALRGLAGRTKPARGLAVGLVASAGVGLLISWFPGTWQSSASVAALVLPLHLGVAGGVWRLTHRLPV